MRTWKIARAGLMCTPTFEATPNRIIGTQAAWNHGSAQVIRALAPPLDLSRRLARTAIQRDSKVERARFRAVPDFSRLGRRQRSTSDQKARFGCRSGLPARSESRRTPGGERVERRAGCQNRREVPPATRANHPDGTNGVALRQLPMPGRRPSVDQLNRLGFVAGAIWVVLWFYSVRFENVIENVGLL